MPTELSNAKAIKQGEVFILTPIINALELKACCVSACVYKGSGCTGFDFSQGCAVLDPRKISSFNFPAVAFLANCNPQLEE